jgi:hypothetical protein
MENDFRNKPLDAGLVRAETEERSRLENAVQESRSIARRVALQKGQTMPTFVPAKERKFDPSDHAYTTHATYTGVGCALCGEDEDAHKKKTSLDC